VLSKKTFLNLLPIALVIILASVLRLWQLGNVPISMSDDEIRLVYTGYSIAHTARDAFGNFLPLVFHMDGASTYGQVPIYLTSLFFLILPLNMFVARLPFALSGILSVVVLYLILNKIFNNSKIALFSAFALSVSVWDLQLTRFAIEIDIAVLMYLVGFLLLRCSKNYPDSHASSPYLV
jgi:4-amino-4-deoxy-L-arabinose transferase-like glycosyltransferase